MAKYVKQIGTILGAVEEANSICEELKDELQSWFDNLPEQFQSGDKGSELEETISSLEEACDKFDSVMSCDEEKITDYAIEYSQVVFARSTYMSRDKRLQLSMCGLQGAPTDVPDEFKDDEFFGDFQDVVDNISEALSLLESVSFPAMR